VPPDHGEAGGVGHRQEPVEVASGVEAVLRRAEPEVDVGEPGGLRLGDENGGVVAGRWGGGGEPRALAGGRGGGGVGGGQGGGRGGRRRQGGQRPDRPVGRGGGGGRGARWLRLDEDHEPADDRQQRGEG